LKIIEIDNVGDVFERALATLYKWKEKQGQEATYGKLAAALNDDLVQRRDLVDRFCCDICPSKKQLLFAFFPYINTKEYTCINYLLASPCTRPNERSDWHLNNKVSAFITHY